MLFFEEGDFRGGGGGGEGFNGRYILVGRLPIPEPNLYKWAAWLEESYRDGTHWIANSRYQRHGKRIWTSTIFLALDFDFHGEGPPVLFESMVFAGGRDGFDMGGASRTALPHVFRS